MRGDRQHRDRIVRAFSAADRYDDHARVQRAAADRLAGHIAALPLPRDARICEIGCGTGALTERLARRLPSARFLVTDLSPQMVERARRRLGAQPRFDCQVVDGEHPQALATQAPFDLICSSLAVQWFSDLRAGLARLAERLAPEGTLAVATLADGTFAEWRDAHAALGLQAGTPDYPTVDALRALAPPGVTAEVQAWTEVDRFERPVDFLRSLRAIGASTPAAAHRPLNAGEMRRVLASLEGGIEVSYRLALCSFRRG